MLLVAKDRISEENIYGLEYYVLERLQEGSNGKVKGGLCCHIIMLGYPVLFLGFLLRETVI